MAESSPYGQKTQWEKGEIARYEQFLLFPLCFQRHVLQTRKNQGLFGKGLKLISFLGLLKVEITW